MSGPKSGSYYLEMQRQAELERQRQLRLARIRTEMASYNMTLERIKHLISAIECDNLDAINESSRLEEMHQTITMIFEAKTEAINKLEKLRDSALPSEPDDIHHHNKQTLAALTQISDVYETRTTDLYARIANFKQIRTNQSKLATLEDKFSNRFYEESLNFDYEFETAIIEESKAISGGIKEEAKEALAQIRDLVNDDAIKKDDRQKLMSYGASIMKAINTSDQNEQAALISFRFGRTSILKGASDFNQYYEKYMALYNLYFTLVNENRVYKLNINPKAKHQFACLQDLITECTTINNLLVKIDEENYIRKSITEVMSEYGFDICEDLDFTGTHSTTHRLYSRHNSDTGIHISMSNNGRLMMEVVGLESRKKISVNGENAVRIGSYDLNAEELQNCYEQQVRFCAMHPEVIEKLKERGVLLKDRNDMAPAIEHSKKIARCEMLTEDETYIDNENIFNIVPGSSTLRQGQKILVEKEMKY